MSKATMAVSAMPAQVLDELRSLGQDISVARRRRRISRRQMAERMMVNPKTVDRMENGDPKLSIGLLATALWVLGMPKRLSGLVSPESDSAGTQEEIRRLPNAIRSLKAAEAEDFDF